jgi:hypothetical protein
MVLEVVIVAQGLIVLGLVMAQPQMMYVVYVMVMEVPVVKMHVLVKLLNVMVLETVIVMQSLIV